MAIDKRDFKGSCLKEADKQIVAKRRGTSILKRQRFAQAPLSARKQELPTPRRLDFDKPVNRIQFYNKVQVVYIPSRDQYPEAMKMTIWSNAEEIKRNARRNTIEFASEGWDWRQCCEDEAMYLSPHTGERIHPVHFYPRAF